VKFYTMVFLEPVGIESFMATLTARLAPFDLRGDASELFDRGVGLDWWRLPQHDMLRLKEGKQGDPRIIRVAYPEEVSVVAAAPKELVDFDALRHETFEHAAGTWDAWAELARTHPGALPRKHFDAIHDTRDEAQQAYLLQPAVQAFAQAAATQQHPYFTFNLLLADPVAQFSGERHAYLARATAESLATYAYLTLDGQWLTQFTDGRGWDAHVLAQSDYLDSVPDETVMTHVYCHK
jgi:hypothetical protein